MQEINNYFIMIVNLPIKLFKKILSFLLIEAVAALRLIYRQVKYYYFDYFSGLFITKRFILSRLALKTLLKIL